MNALNVVRFHIKPGLEGAFLDAHRDGKAAWPGLTRGFIIKTGDRQYVLVGEWPDVTVLAGARDRMIETLNSFRHTLEDQGAGLGVTDAVSGEVVLLLN